MDTLTEKVLIEYVTEQYLDPTKKAKKVIYDFCVKQPTFSGVVFRAHRKTPIIREDSWFSASYNINAASEGFAGNDCCIFVIHLVDIPCINVNKFVGEKIGDKNEEEEVIFLGGGIFYKNKELTEEGYTELGNNNKFNKNMFECWYKINDNKKENIKKEDGNKVERMIDMIDPEEYEFITSVDDIITDKFGLTPEEQQMVFDEIQKRKKSGGKKRRRNRKTKKTKQRNKKHKNQKSKKRRYTKKII